MIYIIFAESTAEASSPLAALGVDMKSLIFQLITFTLVFLILKKFAFKPITKMLAKRHQVIEDGIKLGEKMEKEQARLNEKAEDVIRDARAEADVIVENAQKEAREILRKAEKDAKTKIDGMMKDAQTQIEEDSEHAKRALEGDLTNLVSEATEAVVEEKVTSAKDQEIVKNVLKGRK